MQQPSQPVKAIIFDLGWTLCRPASGHWMIPLKFYDFVSPETMNAIAPERFEPVYRTCMEAMNRDHLLFDEGEEFLRFLAFYTQLAESLPELGLNADDLEEIAYDKVYNDGNMVFESGLREYLLRLKQRVKIAVLSDTWPSTERIMKNLGLWELFDSVTFSCYQGVFKPDAKMYRTALHELGLNGAEAVFVDDLEKNLDGAAACGLRPVQICSMPGLQPCGRYPSVGSLDELPALVFGCPESGEAAERKSI